MQRRGLGIGGSLAVGCIGLLAAGARTASAQSTTQPNYDVRFYSRSAQVSARAPGLWMRRASSVHTAFNNFAFPLGARPITEQAVEQPSLQEELLVPLLDTFFGTLDQLITGLRLAINTGQTTGT